MHSHVTKFFLNGAMSIRDIIYLTSFGSLPKFTRDGEVDAVAVMTTCTTR